VGQIGVSQDGLSEGALSATVPADLQVRLSQVRLPHPLAVGGIPAPPVCPVHLDHQEEEGLLAVHVPLGLRLDLLELRLLVLQHLAQVVRRPPLLQGVSVPKKGAPLAVCDGIPRVGRRRTGGWTRRARGPLKV
jgi:hypothetical protein